MEAKIITKIPGPKSSAILTYNKQHNGGWNVPHPSAHSGEGEGCYFKDVDGNIFLDFASQVASNPLGYNHPDLKEVLKEYCKNVPVKYAGQDFLVKEHNDLIEELLSISPKEFNSAFLINSGAEAIENSIKICMRKIKTAKYCISFEKGFHGRTLGALSLTNTKKIHKLNYLSIPTKRLPYNESASEVLLSLLERESSPEEIACVIIEPIQGEGGYNIPSKKMIKEIREVTKQKGIPFIADEVQSGIGRTGKWWAIENFDVKPDVIAAAKALQVGAVISNKNMFPEEGAISSTWGGGHVIDLAIGIQIIKTIKKKNLLSNVRSMGDYLKKQLIELGQDIIEVQNPRGLGLMAAFDLPSKKMRDNVIIESVKNGLVILGCGKNGIRLIPPYIITENEIDEAVEILKNAVKKCSQRGFKHSGQICEFAECGEITS